MEVVFATTICVPYALLRKQGLMSHADITPYFFKGKICRKRALKYINKNITKLEVRDKMGYVQKYEEEQKVLLKKQRKQVEQANVPLRTHLFVSIRELLKKCDSF